MLQIVWKQKHQSEHGTCDKKVLTPPSIRMCPIFGELKKGDFFTPLLLDLMRMDEEEDDLCTPHKLFNLFSMCTLPSTTTQTKMEADESSVRQVLHHSSVVGDHITTAHGCHKVNQYMRFKN